MRLTLAISSLQPGGAERVMATMANFWAERGWPVTIITVANGADTTAVVLDPRVRTVPLKLAGESRAMSAAILSNVKRVLRLRRVIAASRPDVVVSFMDSVNVLTLFATRGLRVPVIVAERVDPRFHRIGRVWSVLRWFTYRLADRIVVQTRSAATWFSVNSRVTVIPNPVASSPAIAYPRSRAGGAPLLIAIGRLEPQKGFDLVIRAFSRLAERHRRWRLVILGEGKSRHDLEQLLDDHGLTQRVDLPGFVADPWLWLERADLFVLSSRFEGFPNVLCEAMAAGLPVVATDCPSGPGEIVRDGVDGLLVPCEDVEALAVALDRLMSDEAERGRMGGRATEIRTRFALGDVMGRWQSLLEEVCFGGTR